MMVDDATFLFMSHSSNQFGLHGATNSAATTSWLEFPELTGDSPSLNSQGTVPH